MNIRTAILLSFIPTLVACYPMEQAPLVYSSKSTVGASIAGGTPDNPGIDITVGYKAIDVALVPVAVAKYCPEQNGSDCTDPIYNVNVISGGKKDEQNSGDIQDAIREAKKTQNQLIDERSTRQKELGEAESSLAKIALLELRTKEKNDSCGTDAIQTECNAKTQAYDTLEKQISLDDKKSLIERRSKLESDLAGLNKKIDSGSENIAALNKNLSSSQIGNRTDSLSVYGTFSGSANGGKDTASAGGGKVFATGIAAQNLSENAMVVQCLSQISAMADAFNVPAEKTAFLKSTASTCGNASSKK